ncbi:hypothetical protein BaRGS_00012436 [Batillaria attramentaria]|uniref:F5/8 type C domain-containing protein n=1 Tax=Batillaria attramentaria TaxID=370345 RepID=A0ABD0L9N1_9CAEN
MWQLRISLLLLSASLSMTSAWDPDAGLATSWTKVAGVHMTATSNSDDSAQANDGKDSTHWTSKGCLPGGFYEEDPLSNVLYQACQQGRCQSSSDLSQAVSVTDAAGSTAFQVHKGSGDEAFFSIELKSHDELRHVTLRGKFSADTEVVLVDGTTEKLVHTLTPADNYATRAYNVTSTPADKVLIRSSADFTLYGVSAIGQDGCRERVVVDLGVPRQVRYVRTRHWAGGHALTSKLLASDDGVTWQKLNDLDPDALGAYITALPQTITTRYLAVEHRQDETDYAKVYVFEIDAYDENGEYGPAPAPKPNPTNLRQMLGVNGIWGWGWGRSSTTLSPGQGAALYAPVASYGRSYHNLEWDIPDPDVRPDYERMAQGHGTNSKSWVNWDTEYSLWRAANVSVHVSVQFTAKMFPVSAWDHPRDSARQYGNAFAAHFGPTSGNGLVGSVEVGNEPWDYPADFYETVLDGMASGFKEADPNIIVMPGAFQAYDPASTGNYIGTRVTQAVASKIDVINSHHYSWRHWEDGSRHATYPEDPIGSFNEVHSILRWRDANTPDKPVWMTEWGWDSPGGGQDCTKFPECTSEAAASAYAARGLLLHARLGVERSTWFFYGNLDDCDTHVFCRSGLTSSMSAHFVKKGPFYTLEHLLELLGDAHFLSAIQDDDQARVYVFGRLPGSGQVTPTHLVAWRPIDASAAGADNEVSVNFTFNATPLQAWRLRMTASGSGQVSLPTVSGDRWTMGLNAMPVVVHVREDGSAPVGK